MINGNTDGVMLEGEHLPKIQGLCGVLDKVKLCVELYQPHYCTPHRRTMFNGGHRVFRVVCLANLPPHKLGSLILVSSDQSMHYFTRFCEVHIMQ